MQNVKIKFEPYPRRQKLDTHFLIRLLKNTDAAVSPFILLRCIKLTK